MKEQKQLLMPRSTVLVATTALFLVWLIFNFAYLTATQNGTIRFFLTAVFSLLILLRRKPENDTSSIDTFTRHSLGEGGRRSAFFHSLVPGAAIIGTLSVLWGLIFEVHQFEWLGLLILLYASLKWSLPKKFARDIFLALFLLYWAHPLPGPVFVDLQFAMQKMSVVISEWFLHMINARVWADDLVLRTGFNIYEVPAWCSGMRTATTVFLLGLGLGILKRFRWHECLIVVLASLIQALVLNVLRISAMVTLAPKVGVGSGDDFLHDTTGIIVLVGVFLVYLEILILENRKRKRAQLKQELNPDLMKILSEYPPFWRAMLEYKWVIFSGIIIIILSAGLAYKSRPFHRSAMLKDVAIGLRDSGKLEDAQRVSDLIHRLVPDDEEWQLARARLLLIRGKYKIVLSELDKVPVNDEIRKMEISILKAYSFMGLNRLPEAIEIVNELPERERLENPLVTMILAEMALYSDDPDKVARNIIVASQWRPNTGRIRALYPYLRVYRKWNAITDSDLRLPYKNPAQAFSAVEAYMNLNMTPAVASMARDAMNAWPADLRVLEPLYFMAINRPDTNWEDLFGAHLVRSVKVTRNIDALYSLFDKCFQLARPDLVWFLYRRIGEIDPTHPALFMVAARYGHAWFSFRKRYVGISTAWANDKIDLKPFYLLGLSFKSWQSLVDQIPLGPDLAVIDITAAKKHFLDKAIAEFRKRDALSDEPRALSYLMKYEYINALEMAGNTDEARRRLDKNAADRPEEKSKTRIILAGMFERRGDWQNVYETLRDYLPTRSEMEHRKSVIRDIHLPPLIKLCRAQINLRLGLAALHTARETARLFPNSPQATRILTLSLATYDSPEEALLVLNRPRIWRQWDLDIIEAESLFRTERFIEAQSFSKAALLPPIQIPPDITQKTVLPPAELSVLWHRVSIPSERHFADNAKILKTYLESVTSPFLLKTNSLWLEYYTRHPAFGGTRPWTACGRDRMEKAIALNQLTLLLCRQQKFVEARDAANAATDLLPESPILWRILISLSGANVNVVNAARRACPDDSEIWLAELVVKTQLARNARDGGGGSESRDSEEWVCDEINRAVASKAFSAAAMTRAGEYLFRGAMNKAAVIAARDAVSRARGLLPAYVLGIKCAVAENDKDWALECTQKAIKASLHPPPRLYKQLVALKSSDETIDLDGDMMDALRNLCREDPNNPLWPQMLGFIRFKRGGWEAVHAIYQMTVALESGATNRTPYIIGAEASRQLGNIERASDLLRDGLKQHPDNLIMLNNLVYTLSHSPDGLAEAAQLLPRLIRQGKENLQVMDTIAFFYLRSGQFDKANQMLARILGRAEKHTSPWFRARMIQAEITLKRGNREGAEIILEEILKQTREISNEDIITANKLLGKAQNEREKTKQEEFLQNNSEQN